MGTTAYYQANREKVRADPRAYREANRALIATQRRAYFDANADRIRERDRERYRANRELHLQRAAAYHAANPEKVAAHKRRYLDANRDEHRERRRAYDAANPEKKRERTARYRARALAAPVVEAIDRAAIVARDKSICHLCGEPVGADDLHLDHVVPLSRGGEHTAENLRVAHGICNQRKGDRVDTRG